MGRIRLRGRNIIPRQGPQAPQSEQRGIHLARVAQQSKEQQNAAMRGEGGKARLAVQTGRNDERARSHLSAAFQTAEAKEKLHVLAKSST